ncbi:MAG: hypothetical protein MJ093_07440 [Saccharofermentans sp.]|nr:hypothetical protein [Saccharofermentans sp.]
MNRKIIATALLLSLGLTSTVTACSKNDDSVAESTSEITVSEEITIETTTSETIATSEATTKATETTE